MVTVYNGQPVPVTGWYEDRGGDRLFLTEGKLVPACPRHGLTVTRWTLIAPAARSDRDPSAARDAADEGGPTR